jgi:hypothetical protein
MGSDEGDLLRAAEFNDLCYGFIAGNVAVRFIEEKKGLSLRMLKREGRRCSP